MSIFSRLSDIVSSNLNAMLDRAEDPEKTIRLMIQEMQETLVEVRAGAAKLIADRKEATRTLSRIEAAAAEWMKKAELALSKDRDDLAKGALVEKAKLEETGTLLQHDLAAVDEALARHEADIVKLEAKLREAKAKQKTMLTRTQAATAQIRVRKQVHDTRIDDAFTRFEKLERRIDSLEGEAESFDLGQGARAQGTGTLSDQIAALEVDSAIEEEFTKLKERVRGKAPAKS
jgi:phage shock protein A